MKYTLCVTNMTVIIKETDNLFGKIQKNKDYSFYAKEEAKWECKINWKFAQGHVV